MAMPLTVTVLPVPAFWSLKVADVSLKLSVSPETTWLLESPTVAAVVPS